MGFRHSAAGAFVVRDSTGKRLVQFQPDGELWVLWGEKHENAAISQNPNASEFIVRDAAGTIAAKVDAATGDMYLRGSLSEDTSDLRTTSAKELVIRDAAEIKYAPDATKARAILSGAGDLKISGKLNRLKPQP